MRYARLVVTAADRYWLDMALREATGYATSVIGCDAEAGLERYLDCDESLDGRPGAAMLFFAFDSKSLGTAVLNRVGQSLLTCPTTAVFDGLPSAEKRLPLGQQLRYFGDGFQKSKIVAERRLWRIPVMDGEFVVEEDAGYENGIAGGNFLIHAVDRASGLAAARAAVEAIAMCDGCITPFPGGVVRSGSKVGSRYPALKASTSHAYCPTLKNRVDSQVHPDAQVVYEIVIDGRRQEDVTAALACGIRAACGRGIPEISAGNYGGKLGPYHFHVRQVLENENA